MHGWSDFIEEYAAEKREIAVRTAETTIANGLTLTLRPERLSDEREVEGLTRRAFWNTERAEKCGIGCDEHYLCHTLRTSPEFVRELDFVAAVVTDGRETIVGNIMYSAGYIENDRSEKRTVLIFGPLTVMPEYQRTGVGGALLEHTLTLAREAGYGGIIIYGHPEYYPRFGFRQAVEFGVSTHEGANFPAFMGMELMAGYLSSHGGRFYESPLMEVDAAAAAEFDATFEPIKKWLTLSLADAGAQRRLYAGGAAYAAVLH